MGGHEGFQLPGLIQDTELGGVTVSDVAHGVGDVRPQLVGLAEILAVVLLPFQGGERTALQGVL